MSELLKALKAQAKAEAAEMAALANKPDLNADEEARWEELSASTDATVSRIKQLESTSSLGPRPPRSQPGPYNGSLSDRPYGGTYSADFSGTSPARDAFIRLHPSVSMDDGGFANFGEFMSVLASKTFDPRISALAVSAAGSGYGDVSGGVLVPSQFVIDVLADTTENEIVYSRATRYSMTGETLHVSGVDNLDQSDGSLSGFSEQWVEEHGTFTASDIKTYKIKLVRKKLGIYTYASNELVSDVDFTSVLLPQLQAAVREFRDKRFLIGDGVGKPRGLLNDPALITVTKETGQSTGTLHYQNLIKMYSRLHPSLIAGAVWITNPTTIPELLGIGVDVDSVNTFTPVLNQENGAFSIFGRPLLLSSKLPALGSKGDIFLVNLSQYAIGESPQIVISLSEHIRFNTDETAWRVTYRCDGQGKWKSAYTPLNGDSLSWVVTLEAR